MAAPAPVVAVGVSKTFRGGRARADVVAVDDVSLTVEPGSLTAIVGPSGSGKSTLLQLLAGLDRPDAGSVRIGGQEITGLRDRALTRLRRERIGFVFQSFHLLPQLSAAQNIGLPLRLAGAHPDGGELAELAHRRARHLRRAPRRRRPLRRLLAPAGGCRLLEPGAHHALTRL